MHRYGFIVVSLVIVLCCQSGLTQGSYVNQPALDARAVTIIHADGLIFKDLNKNNTLEVYEDWRQPVHDRIADLVSRMTLQEKAGMMLINTLNSDAGGHLSDRAAQCVLDEKMTRFIFRNTVTANPTFVLNHIAKINTNPKLHPLLHWQVGISFGKFTLDFDSAVYRIHYAGKLGKDVVAGAVHNPTSILLYEVCDNITVSG